MIIFPNKVLTNITQAIGVSDTQLKIPDTDYAQLFEAGKGDLYLVLRGPVKREIVKVDLDATLWGSYVTVARGQGGSTAVAWPQGSKMFGSTHADFYNNLVQRGGYRTISYNPNDVLTPLFTGEKVYQDSPAACARWWKAYGGGPYWDIITGEPCLNEQYVDVGWDHSLLKNVVIPPEEHILMVYAEPGDGTIIAAGANWATCRDGSASEAYQQSNNETGPGVNNFGGPYYIIGRSFYEFDLSFFDGVDRTITGIDLDLVAFTRVESTFQCYSSAFTGVTALGDYQDFGSTPFFATAYTMVLWDGGNYARNPLPLNNDGLAYIAAKYSGKAAFCLREYPHDVLNSAPPATPYRNGVWHMECGWSEYQKYPRLVFTYQKAPNWVQKFGPAAWTITNGATWDGAKYTAVGGGVELAPVGTWFKDEHPIKIKVTFAGNSGNGWIEAYNTDGYGELFDNRNSVASAAEVYINNYGNYDLTDLYFFIDNGATITNIEFLYP